MADIKSETVAPPRPPPNAPNTSHVGGTDGDHGNNADIYDNSDEEDHEDVYENDKTEEDVDNQGSKSYDDVICESSSVDKNCKSIPGDLSSNNE